MIYTTGTVSTVSGSAIVSGTGTKWTVNNPAIRAGTLILIKNGNMNYPYMVDRVNSDTELVISQPATFTVKNTSYSINLTEPNSYSDANNRMTAIASDTTYFLRAMDQWMMNNGVVTVELSNGQKVTLDSIKKIQGDIANKLDAKKGGIQWVDGEVRFTDAVGTVSRDEKNAAWLSLTRTEPDIYIKRNGVADTYKFPDTRGGKLLSSSKIYDYKNPVIVEKDTSLALQCYHDFRKHYMGLRDIISYPFGYSSGFVDYKTLFGGTSTRAVGLVNFRNWGDKSGHGSCFQLMSIGGDGVDGYTGLYCRQGITGSEQYPEAIPSVFKLLDNRQVEGVDNAMLNNTNMPTMFFRQGGGAGTSDWFSGWGSGINLKYDWNNSVKIFFHGSSGVPTIATKRGSDIWWNVLLGSANTTVDSNGFVKKASPIININPDGTFTTNDESEGATVTRVAQGEYLIEGVLGFNSDAGWGGVDGGIEIPLDVNKQPLIWVDSKVMEDGSILVRTYHRTHPNAPEFANNKIDGYKDGDPIDIPDGRFISVRVQMPEQSIYNVRMREMEETQKAEEERRQKEEEMKEQYGLGENDVLL